jgi:hypothetical protein
MGWEPSHDIIHRKTARVLPVDVIVMTAFPATWTRADDAPSRQRLTTNGHTEQVDATANNRAVRWILSIPSVPTNTATSELDIAESAADEVPGVADTHVPNFIVSRPRRRVHGIPWAPLMWTRGLGGARG